MLMKSGVFNMKGFFHRAMTLSIGRITSLMLFGVSCFGQNTDLVVKKIFELDKDKDGTPELKIETHTRGKTRLFVQMQRKLPSGAWSATRSYSVSGKTFVIEEDRDGDGIFETIVVLDPYKKDLEVFSRQLDSSIVVESPDVKAIYGTMFSALEEFWQKAFEDDTKIAIEKLIIETKQKIESAGKVLQEQQQSPIADNERRPKPQ